MDKVTHRNSGINNPMFGKIPWNKGIKMPHSKEWEEKRLNAVREACKNKIWTKGYARPESSIKPMREGFKKWQQENPDAVREIAIRNLSKNRSLSLSKENSPWWKGGITSKWQKWKSEHGKNFTKWRNAVYLRYNKTCLECGSKEDIEAHHIISVRDYKCFAFLPMNGICLCHNCHKKTDSFGGKGTKGLPMETNIGKTSVIIHKIPHKFQAYPTAGNYGKGTNGEFLIFISEIGDERSNLAVAIHEIIEFYLTEKAGIDERDITAFDIANLDHEDPGMLKDAPYHKQHLKAILVEKAVCKALKLSWKKHNQLLDNLK